MSAKPSAVAITFPRKCRTALDMTTRPWGKLQAVEKGSLGYWYFNCGCGRTRVLLDGAVVRLRQKKHDAGKATEPDCGGCVKMVAP